MALIPRKNLSLASTLIFISVGLGVFTFLITPYGPDKTLTIVTFVITEVVLILLGFFVRVGHSWARYVYAGLLVLGMIAAPFTIMRLLNFPFYLLIYLIQLFIQITAAVYMFKRSDSPYHD